MYNNIRTRNEKRQFFSKRHRVYLHRRTIQVNLQFPLSLDKIRIHLLLKRSRIIVIVNRFFTTRITCINIDIRVRFKSIAVLLLLYIVTKIE